MENQEDLLREFFLLTETHKNLDDNIENPAQILDLATNDELWSNIFDLKCDNNQLKEFFTLQIDDTRRKYFKFGISLYYYFIQTNFTGPALPDKVVKYLEQERFKSPEFLERLSVQSNEEINNNVKHPALLVVCQIIFDCCPIDSLVNTWWCFRAIMAHQECVDELSTTLLTNTDRLYKSIQTVPIKNYVKAELFIELAQLYLLLRQVLKAKDCIKVASEILGVTYDFVGKLGKRTKCQEKELAQLTVQVSLEDRVDVLRKEVEDFILPRCVKLDDDTRLDQIEFKQEENGKLDVVTTLGNTEQKLFLAIFLDRKHSTPQDELKNEELYPILDLILKQKNTYSVRVRTLFLRCKLENKDKRAIERCLKQCEEILDGFTKSQPSAIQRIGDVASCGLCPLWKIEAQYAEIMLDIGLVKQSLDIYLKLKLWEEVIVCYTILMMRHKAIEVIREQMDVRPSVKLMCLLGDATDDVKCYENAWEMSKKRSFRAQRHWGQYYFHRKQYEDAIPHFEKALSINPIQPNIWLRLGYAALQIERWQTAATAYRRYTTLEPNGFEAWNNMAQAYIKTGNKLCAHQALLEALKYTYDNWKVWENFLLVSFDVKKYFDVIRAYHRLLELKEKYLNCDVINVLVMTVKDDSRTEESSGSLLHRTRELLGRLVAAYPGNGFLWELYSVLAPSKLTKAQRLQRAYRSYTQCGWDKDLKSCKQVLNVCGQLLDIVVDSDIDTKNAIVNSIKLNVASALAAVKKLELEDTKEILHSLGKKMDVFNEKLGKIEGGNESAQSRS